MTRIPYDLSRPLNTHPPPTFNQYNHPSHTSYNPSLTSYGFDLNKPCDATITSTSYNPFLTSYGFYDAKTTNQNSNFSIDYSKSLGEHPSKMEYNLSESSSYLLISTLRNLRLGNHKPPS
ncbi:hypothetical protein C1645_830248 [Glomus cerebriforme]|uniref:Uncharacterized protein n=1 Tax=Glomus cerebriforme TaxID=658196 RepID=A0A397SHY5_9GLOM|nr:hypothetical protein C1645_830248 [Glomus cerebriforme]